jgi:hypothetical protein
MKKKKKKRKTTKNKTKKKTMKKKKKTMKKMNTKKRFTYIRLVVTSTLFWDVTQRRFVVTDVSGQPTGALLYREWRGL